MGSYTASRITKKKTCQTNALRICHRRSFFRISDGLVTQLTLRTKDSVMPLVYALFFLALAEALPAEYKLLHGPDPKDPM